MKKARLLTLLCVLVVAAAPGAARAADCLLDEEFARLKNKYESLEAIKNNPDLFQVYMDYEAEPFEICIKDGVATLNAEPETWQKLAGFTAAVLEGAITAYGLSESVGAAVGESVSKEITTAARRKLTDAGKYMSLADIKLLARRAEDIGEITKSAVSQALKPVDPLQMPRAWAPELERHTGFFGGGPLKTTTAQGLRIYMQLQAAADLVRANSKAVYCKIYNAQVDLARAIAKLGRRAARGEGKFCNGSLLSRYKSLRQMSRKLHHDAMHVGAGYVAEFGDNWTLHSQYADLDCVRNRGRAVPRLKKLEHKPRQRSNCEGAPPEPGWVCRNSMSMWQWQPPD